MTDYDADVRDFVSQSLDLHINPNAIVWAIFDRRCEIQNPMIFDAMTQSGLAQDPDKLDTLPTGILELAARLLPADATNSTFDELLWDIEDLIGPIG